MTVGLGCESMATYLDGNVRKATANTVRAMRRSAESRQCPQCGRKSAMVRFSEDWAYGRQCRWDDCRYGEWTDRDSGERHVSLGVRKVK